MGSKNLLPVEKKTFSPSVASLLKEARCMHAVGEEYEETSSESDYIDCVILAQQGSIGLH